ncbi:unnamed protein product, partial [Staurois parvus]
MLSLMCISREFFFSWKSACDRHRAHHRCLDRGSGVLQPHGT